ncbi:hypothetical protein FOZ62_019088, partial [Perkinsus olseni]
NVRMSSISGGACMLIVLALQHVEISEMMLLGLRMMERMIKNNGTGTYFLKQEEVMDQILRDLRVMCHMEDEDVIPSTTTFLFGVDCPPVKRTPRLRGSDYIDALSSTR